MSRSSRGFADFFPTAPAVLKARKKSRSPSASGDRLTQAAPSKAVSVHQESNGTGRVGASPNGSLSSFPERRLIHEDPEPNRVDLVHEVGSASSTSTTSSMFSAKYRPGKFGPKNVPQIPTDLTPLTNIDSSPRANSIHSPAKRPVLDSRFVVGPTPASPSDESLGKGYSPTDSETSRTTELDKPSARPGKGEVKGYRITYDPATDRSSKAKDKRNREAQYEPFGHDVSDPEQNIMHNC